VKGKKKTGKVNLYVQSEGEELKSIDLAELIHFSVPNT